MATTLEKMNIKGLPQIIANSVAIKVALERLKVDVDDPTGLLCNDPTENSLVSFFRGKKINLRNNKDIVNNDLAYFRKAEEVYLSGCDSIDDKGVENLRNVKYVELSGCNLITDEGLKNLRNVEKITLLACGGITDNGLGYLKRTKVIDLSYCPQITDRGIRNFCERVFAVNDGMIDSIRIDHNRQITDKSLEYLADCCAKSGKKIKYISVADCENITGKGLAGLKGRIEGINLSHCEKIKDKILSYLQGVSKIDISSCYKITDEGLKYLEGVEDINVSYCGNITDKGIKALAGYVNGVINGNVKTIEVSNCHKLTNSSLAALGNATKIDIRGCNRMSNAGLYHVRDIKNINLCGCKWLTDNGLNMLKNVEDICMDKECNLATGKGLQDLKNLRHFCAFGCGGISSDALSYIGRAELVLVQDWAQLTDDGLKYLETCKEVFIFKCHNVTYKGINSLSKKIKKVWISECEGLHKEDFNEDQKNVIFI